RRAVLIAVGRGAIIFTAVLYFAFAGVVAALRYAIVPRIAQYRPEIEVATSHALGLDVAIGEVAADWDGLHPQLTLRDVVVHDHNGRDALRLPRVVATLSWETLGELQIRLRSLEIDRPELEIRRRSDGRIS